MSETAVAEPEVTTATEAATPEQTEATPEVTGEGTELTEATVQTNADPETTDPVETEEERVNRLADARAAALLEEREAARAEELRTKSTTEEQQRAWDEVKTAFPTTVKAIRDEISEWKFTDELGNQVRPTPEQIESVLKHVNTYNLKAVQAAKLEAYVPISDAAYELLPKEVHQAFTDAANGKAPKDYLEAFAEHKALSTKAVKGLDLEGAKKVSAKLNKEIVEFGEGRFDAGVAHGKTLPLAEPKSNGGASAGRGYTLAEIDAMPTSKWMSLGTADERRQILADARAQASRG